MRELQALVAIASDLTRAIPSSDRYTRLLDAVRRVVPCDAAALLRTVEGDDSPPTRLTVAASHGLVERALGMTFELREQPRLSRICSAQGPVRFPADSPLRDPFDGLLALAGHRTPDSTPGSTPDIVHVHACLGVPLRVEGRLVGALTADAATVGAYDAIAPGLLEALGALAGAAVHTSDLVESLERSAARDRWVASELVQDGQRAHGGPLVGIGPAMQRVRRDIALVAPSDISVLVTGETGVGKELVVRAIHAASRRRERPLVQVNCGALPETLAESELFGHVRGAFTGALRDRPGKFDVADKGTLFLDEIGELPAPLQATLLRALQSGEIQRVGSDRPLRVDVRVVAATNRNLEAEVRAGRFRADLYHRLAVYPLQVPPLREHLEDVPTLVRHFGDAARKRLGTGPLRFSEDALVEMGRYGWPGNVRELENVLQRAVLRASSGARARGPAGRDEVVVVSAEHLGIDLEADRQIERQVEREGELGSRSTVSWPPTSSPPSPTPSPTAGEPRGSLRQELDGFQRALISEVLAHHEGNWASAARALGLDRGNLHRLATRLGLRKVEPDRPEHRR